MNIREVPFSRRGSFLTISPLFTEINNDLFIRSVRGGDLNTNLGYLFKIELIDDKNNILNYEVDMYPNQLILKNESGFIKFAISDENFIIFHAEGVGLKLTRKTDNYDNCIELNNRYFSTNCTNNDLRIITYVDRGNMVLNAPWQEEKSKYISIDFHTKDNLLYGIIEEFNKSIKIKKYDISYNDVSDKSLEDFILWKNNSLKGLDKYKKGFDLANYITWSSLVPVAGKLLRPAMYMSKNWMLNIWSWDNCFNALALIENNPKLALDQLMLFFDYQDANGILPDFINDKYAYYAFTKPPIEGWLLKIFMDKNPNYLTLDILNTIYVKLSLWTNYWIECTDYDNSALPSYAHGNDAGWDNSTIFSEGGPLKSPDLLSFLIIQMDTLSVIADKINNKKEIDYWKEKSDVYLNKLIDYYWIDNKFKPIKTNQENSNIKGDSLINYIPIILGKKLNNNILKNLYKDLKTENRFLTEYGLATESLQSSYYEDDGYWRGPIWAPSTMLIVYGLIESGYNEFALDLSNRFLKMANLSGMAENFDAKTGRALRDKSFTWTSSVFLYLNNLLLKERGNQYE